MQVVYDSSDSTLDFDEEDTSSSEESVDTKALLCKRTLQEELGVRLGARGFRNVQRVGSGHFCNAVFSAEYEDKPVAVKLCMRKDHELLLYEANVLATIDHPNIIAPYGGVEQLEDRYFLKLELVQGQDLVGVLEETLNHRTNRLCDFESAIHTITRSILQAILYLHKKEYIHNDIKPENILIGCATMPEVTTETAVKLCDFGLVTTPLWLNSHAGSPAWFSPEKIFRDEPVTTATDIFSYGLLFYTCCTGRMIFGSYSVETWPRGLNRISFKNMVDSVHKSVSSVSKRGVSPKSKHRRPYLEMFSKNKEAKDVVLKSTGFQTCDRLSAQQLLELPYFPKEQASKPPPKQRKKKST